MARQEQVDGFHVALPVKFASHLERKERAHAVAEERDWAVAVRWQHAAKLFDERGEVLKGRFRQAVFPTWKMHTAQLHT
jgi:hypothetical protein